MLILGQITQTASWNSRLNSFNTADTSCIRRRKCPCMSREYLESQFSCWCHTLSSKEKTSKVSYLTLMQRYTQGSSCFKLLNQVRYFVRHLSIFFKPLVSWEKKQPSFKNWQHFSQQVQQLDGFRHSLKSGFNCCQVFVSDAFILLDKLSFCQVIWFLLVRVSAGFCLVLKNKMVFLSSTQSCKV